jgi:hypothetical protein
MAQSRPTDDRDDPGWAQERTDLAWTRTAISFARVGAAAVHTSVAVGLLVFATAALVWALGRLPARHDRGPNGWTMMPLFTTTTLFVGLLALLVVSLTAMRG